MVVSRDGKEMAGLYVNTGGGSDADGK